MTLRSHLSKSLSEIKERDWFRDGSGSHEPLLMERVGVALVTEFAGTEHVHPFFMEPIDNFFLDVLVGVELDPSLSDHARWSWGSLRAIGLSR